jgi:hypothetical protein
MPVTRQLRLLVERSATLYPYYQAWRDHPENPITADTDLVISGYQGSGNSFARAAIALMNPGIRIASHGHCWTETANAVRRHLPVMLLVREPEGAIISQFSRFSDYVRPQWALADYERLHTRVLPYLDSVEVVDFDEVTTRFGDVIARVNSRFGTTLAAFDHDDATLTSSVFAAMAEEDDRKFGLPMTGQDDAASRERAQRREEIVAELARPRWQAGLASCRSAYEAVLDAAGIAHG